MDETAENNIGTQDADADADADRDEDSTIGDVEVPTDDGSAESSQLIHGPTSGDSAGGMRSWPSQAPDDLSIGGPSNDGSYFILDERGRHVLDDQGSPARARKWQPVNAQQRERYTRLHLATKGPRATCRWLPSVLVSPDHLKIPRARTDNYGGPKGHRYGNAECSSAPSGFNQKQQILPGSIVGSNNSAGEHEDDGGQGWERRREIEVAKKRRCFLVEERRRLRPKQLDGFMLMDACGCDLPDEGRRADVSGRGLVSVVAEDMSFFIRLQTLDAGDNNLPFESFVDLPSLDELRLPCNNIRDIDVPELRGQQQMGGARIGGYHELRRLDLSYNGLSAAALSALTRLPNLTDLDLTCNGLADLPTAMASFPRLQKLSLERNQLESDAVFDVLSKLRTLRELNLAFNYFTGVQLRPEAAECVFPLLEGLDLGFNYIGSESDVVVLVLLGKLQRIILYGNPLMGPTGEDPLGLCVEKLVEESDRVRGDYGNYPIEVITELPRIKHGGGGRKAGGRRRRPYSDIGITMVDEGYLPPAAAFRNAGNRSLFGLEQQSNYGESDGDAADKIVEATLRSVRGSDNRTATAASRSAATAAAAGAQDLTFLTGVERQEAEDEGGEVDKQSGGSGGMSTRLLRGPVDPIGRRDPVKLRMALSALRYSLKHPVMSSMDTPWQQQLQRKQQSQQHRPENGNNNSKAAASNNIHCERRDVGRKTAAARARQLPRRPYRLLKGPHQKGFCAGLLDGQTNGGSSKGLGRVDEVLTSMGAAMDAMVLERRASQNNHGTQPGSPELSSIIRTVNAVLDENEY